MRYLLILLVLCTSTAWAQRRLDQHTYQVKVRPILNGIVGDFYQMVTLFPYFPQEIIPIIQEVSQLEPSKDTLLKSCPGLLTKECGSTANTLRERLFKIQTLSLKLKRQVKMSPDLHLSSISALRFISLFDLKLESIKANLDNISLLINAEIPAKYETHSIIKDLDELDTMVSLALQEFIPYAYREDFQQFFLNFIQPIKTHLAKRANPEFLYRNMNPLNFSVNLLNMNLTKRKKTPDGMGSYLATMHARWNSLLRYYF